jgi:hypothetical protein
LSPLAAAARVETPGHRGAAGASHVDQSRKESVSMKRVYRWTLVAAAVLLTAQMTQAQQGGGSAAALTLTTRPLQFTGTAGATAAKDADSLTLRTRPLQFTGIAGR